MEVYKKEKPPEMTTNVVKSDGFKRKKQCFQFFGSLIFSLVNSASYDDDNSDNRGDDTEQFKDHPIGKSYKKD